MGEETRDRSGSGFVVIAAALLLLIGYPLSLGPAVWLHRSPATPVLLQRLIEILYFPLEWLVRNTWLREPIEWYVSHWR